MALLRERQTTHGDFAITSSISQELKHHFRGCEGWVELEDAQREALDLIATKIARILSGDPNCEEHWDDIGGYARLPVEIRRGRRYQNHLYSAPTHQTDDNP